jgi:hypothetical protein
LESIILFYAQIVQSSMGKSPTPTARAARSDKLDTKIGSGSAPELKDSHRDLAGQSRPCRTAIADPDGSPSLE